MLLYMLFDKIMKLQITTTIFIIEGWILNVVYSLSSILYGYFLHRLFKCLHNVLVLQKVV